MPYKDGTGPNGKGPRTGRGRGNCSSDDLKLDKSIKDMGKVDLEDLNSDVLVRPIGRGRGLGRGIGRNYQK